MDAATLSLEEQRRILMHGVEEVVPEGALDELLRRAQQERRPLRIKLGIDPTASDIHLGFAVVLRKLRQFQDLGHVACLVQLIGRAGFAASNREARQLVEQGAVSIDGERVGDPGAQVRPADGSVLKVGKRRFARLRTE